MARKTRRIYHDLEKRSDRDRRVGAGGYTGPERRVAERRAHEGEEKSGPNIFLIAAMLLLAAILADNYFYQGEYRHHLSAQFGDTSQSLRAWSDSLWGA
jgi:hypothetical protein